MKGFNTDDAGASKLLKSLQIRDDEKILIRGGGGVAKAILFALQELELRKVVVYVRSPSQAKEISRKFSYEVVTNREPVINADILINATSIGMRSNTSELPFTFSAINCCRAIMDVVVSPMKTDFMNYAESRGKQVAPGYLMSMEQAREQFHIYTGVLVPVDLCTAEVLKLLREDGRVVTK